jgi:tetratricopeptide (TPR) repeat protein
LILIDDPQAMEDETSNLILGASLHCLGNHYYQTKQYEQALNYFNNCLKIYLRVLPSDDVRLTPTYNNIGSIYHRQDLNEKALEYHLKAYQIQKNSKDPDMDSISAYVGNIASVIMKLGRYKEALIYLELDLQIKQKIHSNTNHPDIAVKYHNLAAAQYRIHQYEEALTNYEKCLQIELKCHSDEKATVAVTYYNMATTLEELGRLQEAKEAVENAIKRLLLTKNEDDEQIQMHKKYLQRLEQKIWMKNVFSNK